MAIGLNLIKSRTLIWKSTNRIIYFCLLGLIDKSLENIAKMICNDANMPMEKAKNDEKRIIQKVISLIVLNSSSTCTVCSIVAWTIKIFEITSGKSTFCRQQGCFCHGDKVSNKSISISVFISLQWFVKNKYK